MNDNTYENIMNYINNEIRVYKYHLNYIYGWESKSGKQKVISKRMYENLTQLQSIKLFVQNVHRNAFDKRFFDLMFGSDLLAHVDTKKLTQAIVELVANAHKTFPRKVKE